MEEKGEQPVAGFRGNILNRQWRRSQSNQDENIIDKSVLKRTYELQQSNVSSRRNNNREDPPETFQERSARFKRNEINAELDRISNPFDQSLLVAPGGRNAGSSVFNTNDRDDVAASNTSADVLAHQPRTNDNYERDRYARLESSNGRPARQFLSNVSRRFQRRRQQRARRPGIDHTPAESRAPDQSNLSRSLGRKAGTHENYVDLKVMSGPTTPHPGGFGGQNGAPPSAPGAPGAPPANVPDSYFTESKKGEVNELRQLLRNFNVERDPTRKREIIKKVIAYMTLGIDVSRLFSEMMLAIETRDLVIKKMVYLFLCNYATTHPELAQMCTNTLQKDCGNEDPMVRGLALRALCSLRLPQMVEYISEPLRRSLSDHHAYVRKTGVMGILKLYHLDREKFDECNFVDILYDMLRDPDAQVVSNCILVLNEIMAQGPDGGMALNRAVMLHLLNRIHEFSEFGIVAVIELVPRYIPANDEEGFQIMNLLDPVLQTSNSAAVLATIRAFISLADQIGDDPVQMKRQVVGRVKASLVTLVASSCSELAYSLLKHVDSLVDSCPGIFDDEYRQFYTRYHEPTHIKYLKVQILPKLANPDNAPDIVSELGECVADRDSQISRLAVRSMSQIACRDVGGEGCAESIARRLVEMLDLDVSHVCAEAATALADVLRKHPSLKPLVAPPLPRALRYIAESNGKASVVHLLGECGDIVREAPYALEKLIDSYDDISDAGVKIALLTATMKLFFKRPPEVQKMLGRLLAKATEDVSSQDLHDRALMYYRLLSSAGDPKIVEQVVSASPVVEGHGVNFAEEEDKEHRDALMEEFNTMSTLYGTTSENFIGEEYQVKLVRMPKEHPLEAGAAPVVDPGVNGVADSLQQTSINDAAPEAAPSVPAASGEVDLLGFGNDSAMAPAPTTAPTGISLDNSFNISGEEYQAKWEAVPDSDALSDMMALRLQPESTDLVESALSACNMSTMASGELPTELKFFLYGREEGGSGMVFLIQAVIFKPPDLSLSITIKTSGGDQTKSQELSQKVIDLMKTALRDLI